MEHFQHQWVRLLAWLCHDVYTDFVSHLFVLSCFAPGRWPQNFTGMTHITLRLRLNCSARVRYIVTATMCVFAAGTCQTLFYRSQKRRISFLTQPPPLNRHPSLPPPSSSGSTSMTCFALESKAMFSEALIVLFFCAQMIFIAVYCRLDCRASSIWGCMVLSLAVAQPRSQLAPLYNACQLLLSTL